MDLNQKEVYVKRRRLLGAAVAVAFLISTLLVPQAGAHLLVRSDPDDTAGRFDIRETAFRHAPNDFLVFAQTQDNWSNRHLGGGNVIWWDADTEGSDAFEFKIKLVRSPYGPRCIVKYKGDFVGSHPAEKDGRLVLCGFPNLGHKRVVHWRAASTFNNRTDRTRTFSHGF